MKKNQVERTYSHSDQSSNLNYKPLYYNGEVASVGDLVRYANLIDVANRYDYNADQEIYLLASISEEMVGVKEDTDDPMHAVEDLQWLADIRNNKSSHIINLSYLVKVKGV